MYIEQTIRRDTRFDLALAGWRRRKQAGAFPDGPLNMRMEAIDSSAISAVGYEEQILRLAYRNGRVYDYLDVPQEEFRRFMESESRGEYVNKVIKPNYRFREVFT